MCRKKTFTYVYLTAVLALLFTSCQEDREIANNSTEIGVSQKADVVVKNGLLHFKDQSTWESIIVNLQQEGNYNLWKTSIGFENSLLDKYESIKESDEELENYFKKGALPKIQDNLFAGLLNEDAMVKIGKTLYKITDENTFSVVDEDGSMLKQFKERSASIEKLPNVTTFKNIDHLANKTIVLKDQEGKETARFQGSSEVDFMKPGSTTMKAELGAWSRTYAVYSSVGVKIETQSYRSGGIFGNKKWRSRDSDYLYCWGITRTQECYPVDGCGAKFLASGSNSNSGNNRCERTIVQAPTGWHVTDYIDGDYRVRFDAGEPIYTTTVFFE